MSYWCTFKGQKSQTINVDYDKFTEADKSADGYISQETAIRQIRQTARQMLNEEPLTVDELPYPASPQLNPQGTPSFCYSPSTCKGRSSCPQRRSCCD